LLLSETANVIVDANLTAAEKKNQVKNFFLLHFWVFEVGRFRNPTNKISVVLGHTNFFPWIAGNRNSPWSGRRKIVLIENSLLDHFIHFQLQHNAPICQVSSKVKVTLGKSCCFLPVVLKYLMLRFYFYFFPSS
jgi:hypothetical protein